MSNTTSSSGAPARPDGRQAMQLRGRELRLATLSRVDGSCFYAQGQSSVMVAVAGPAAARVEDYTKCSIDVRITFSSHACSSAAVQRGGDSDVLLAREANRHMSACVCEQIQSVVQSCVESAVMTERYARCVLTVDVTVLHSDGSVGAVVLNAVMCALLDAGVACRHSFAALSIAAVMECTPIPANSEENISRRTHMGAESSPIADGESTKHRDVHDPCTIREREDVTKDEEGDEVTKRRRVDLSAKGAQAMGQANKCARALTFWLDPSAAEECQEDYHNDENTDAAVKMRNWTHGDAATSQKLCSASASRVADRARTVALGLFVLSNAVPSSSSDGSQLLVSRVHRSRREDRLGNLSAEEVESMANIAERAAPLLFRFMRQCNVTMHTSDASG